MVIESIDELPLPDSDLPDWAVFSHCQSESEMNLLIYASHRDFLSTPRSYSVVRFYASDNETVTFFQTSLFQFMTDYQIDSELPEDAFYKLSDESDSEFVLTCQQRALVIEACRYELVGKVYHSATAAQALSEFLLGQN